MRVGLISPITIPLAELDYQNDAAAASLAARLPLGVLTLASIVRDCGFELHFIDLNDLLWEFHGKKHNLSEFCNFAAARIEERRLEVLGFGSICSSFPLTLRIASACRQADDNVFIVLGGPQASVVDRAVLEAFEAVDAVVRGEAEHSFPRLLDAIAHKRTSLFDGIPGITYRRQDHIVQTAQAQTVTDIDLLPFPAYDLFPLVESATTLPVELGRGCPYACTFCSTNDFFRRRFRLRSPQQTLRQMEQLHNAYGVRHFELVHDMFTVDRKRVVEFCETVAPASFSWNCSARTDRIDPDLLDLMQEAGCCGVFYGIETGSPDLHKTIRKRLDLDEAKRAVRQTSDRGITAITSLIVGFPTETAQDVQLTIDALVSFLELENAHPQLHLLSPLAGTPIHREYAGQLEFDTVCSDISANASLAAADWSLVKRYPDVFPDFYGLPCSVGRRELRALRDLITLGLRGWRLFLIGLHRCDKLLDIAKSFQDWQTSSPQARRSSGDEERLAAYLAERFRNTRWSHVAKALVSIWHAANRALNSSRVSYPVRQAKAAFARRDTPTLQRGTAVVEIPFEYLGLKRWILGQVSRNEVVCKPQWLSVRIKDSDSAMISVLSGVGKDLLALCDGTRTIAEIASMQLIRGQLPDANDTLAAFEMLRKEGYVT
jgi:hypothetical protein